MFQWTPEGRRLVTGASSGEFTLWNGLTFNFETILQVNNPPRCMVNSDGAVGVVSMSDEVFTSRWADTESVGFDVKCRQTVTVI